MRYTTEVSINLPREEVIKLFDSTENLFKWQEGLLSFDHLEGKPGEEGASSQMVYESRKGKLVMTETITRRDFPEAFSANYKAKGVYNEVNNYFTETTPGQTTWKMINYFRFSGLMALMAPFMKSAFASHTLLSMERFRTFADPAHL